MLRRCLLVISLIAVGVFTGVALAQTKATQPDPVVVGAWRLVSVETIRPNGEVIYPYYGKHPQGLIVYDRSGWMSVQIVSDPMPVAPEINSRDAVLAADTAKKIAALEGYYAYYGTWTLDAAHSTVTHHVKQALYPGERDEEFVRHFALEGDRLTLTVKTHEMNEDHERKLVWQRLQGDQP